MSLLYAPHTVVCYPPVDSVAGNAVIGTDRTVAEKTISCQITPMTPGRAFDSFNLPSEVKRPHLLLTNQEYAPYIREGSRLTYGTREFTVVTPTEIWDAIPGISCAAAVLEEKHLG